MMACEHDPERQLTQATRILDLIRGTLDTTRPSKAVSERPPAGSPICHVSLQNRARPRDSSQSYSGASIHFPTYPKSFELHPPQTTSCQLSDRAGTIF